MSEAMIVSIIAFILGGAFVTVMLLGPLGRLGDNVRREIGKPPLSTQTVRRRVLPFVLFACAVGSIAGYFLIRSGALD